MTSAEAVAFLLTPHSIVVLHSPTSPGRLCVPFAPRPPARLACARLHQTSMTKGKKPVDAATALVRLDDGHVVDVSSLHPKSLPGELVYAFGQAMGEVADKFNRIHKYVT